LQFALSADLQSTLVLSGVSALTFGQSASLAVPAGLSGLSTLVFGHVANMTMSGEVVTAMKLFPARNRVFIFDAEGIV
jgi:hypothetical protein